MTFKQKLAQTLISEIELCREIAIEPKGENPETHKIKWNSMAREAEVIAETMFGIDSMLDHREIILELKKIVDGKKG
jgi:hypothetical protein